MRLSPTHSTILFAVLALCSGLLLTACPIPVPRNAIVQPRLTILLKDDKGRPVPKQKVHFAWLSHPHSRLHQLQRLHTDSKGVVQLPQRIKREWIMPLMMHGVPQHFWLYCIRKKGYQTLHRPIYRVKKNHTLTLTLTLKPGKTTACPSRMHPKRLYRPGHRPKQGPSRRATKPATRKGKGVRRQTPASAPTHAADASREPKTPSTRKQKAPSSRKQKAPSARK